MDLFEPISFYFWLIWLSLNQSSNSAPIIDSLSFYEHKFFLILSVKFAKKNFHQIAIAHRSISTRTSGRWPSGRWLRWTPIGRHCGGRPPSWAAQAAASTSWRNTSDGLYCRNSNETLILLAASNILTPSVDIFMRVVPYAPHPLSLSEPMGVGVRSAVENFESEVTVQCA